MQSQLVGPSNDALILNLGQPNLTDLALHQHLLLPDCGFVDASLIIQQLMTRCIIAQVPSRRTPSQQQMCFPGSDQLSRTSDVKLCASQCRYTPKVMPGHCTCLATVLLLSCGSCHPQHSSLEGLHSCIPETRNPTAPYAASHHRLACRQGLPAEASQHHQSRIPPQHMHVKCSLKVDTWTRLAGASHTYRFVKPYEEERGGACAMRLCTPAWQSR